MRTRPLAFNLIPDEPCHVCGREDNVLTANVKEFPSTCVVCLFRAVDIPMEWRLSNTAVQTLAHREHAARIADEQDEMQRGLSPELRTTRKR